MIQATMKEVITKNGREKIIIQIPKDFDNDKEKAMVVTTTREPFMPARLYFKFLKRKALIKALDRCNCIDWDDENNFTIHYWEEAKNMGLSVPYDEVPEEVFPVLLAHGCIVGSSEVYVDVRSLNRVIGILKFLNKYIGPRFMYVTHVATYNRYISSQEDIFQNAPNLDFNELFSEENLQKSMPNMTYVEENNLENDDDEEAHRKQWEKTMEQPIPVIRKIPVTGTKSGIMQLQFSLTLAQFFAKEYFEGNNNFNPMNMIKALAFDHEEHH